MGIDSVLSVKGRTVRAVTRLRHTRRGWEEIAPNYCPNGHVLKRNALVGTAHCDCGTMHRSHSCKACGATVYTPEMGDGCARRELDGR